MKGTTKAARTARRDLFAELSEGLDALARPRFQGLVQPAPGDQRMGRLDPEALTVGTRRRMPAPPKRHPTHYH